ncbi:peptidylprolyl isomerase [Glaciecola sp. SC05]|uniref:peptidylprolyl isomerase n=1 Tax=Glaciecola sp. SC05 TaxID=1987355 RepID=UPI003527BD16
MQKPSTLIIAAWLLLSIKVNASEKLSAQSLSQENLVYLSTDEGLVIFEMAPLIAPKHVARFKALVAEGFYDGLDFYRVIDGFAAQGGDQSEQKKSQHRQPLAAEFTREVITESTFTMVQSPEFLAEQTGFIEGFPAGKSKTEHLEWLLHCPGAVGMARNNEADSATTDFYVVIGQAPRHLDRNMSVFAQVVYGLENLQSMIRGNPNVNSGVIDEGKPRSKIIWAKLGTQVDMTEQMLLSRNAADSEAFQKRLSDARTLKNEFYQYKGTGNIDVCYYRPRITVASVDILTP